MAMASLMAIGHWRWWCLRVVSSRQSVLAEEDWLLGTQAAPAWEAGASAQGRLMTADRSPAFAVPFRSRRRPQGAIVFRFRGLFR
jgi:hypothetical protein